MIREPVRWQPGAQRGLGNGDQFREETGISAKPFPALLSSFHFFLLYFAPRLQRIGGSCADTMLIQSSCQTFCQKQGAEKDSVWRGQAGHGEGLLSFHAEEIIRVPWATKIRVERSFNFLFFKCSLSSDFQSYWVGFSWKCHGVGSVPHSSFFSPPLSDKTISMQWFFQAIKKFF